MRILLAEDDLLLGEAVCTGLGQAGMVVDWVTDGNSAMQAASAGEHGLVVLDLGLPGCSGGDVLRRLRGHGNDLPVLVLTARDTVEDRVRELDAGADDYLIKPFDMDELSARVRALLRRYGGRADPLLEYAGLVLDPAAHTITRDGQPVTLPPREFGLLQVLLENTGRVLTRRQLEAHLYGWGDEVESNTIEVHVHNLRKKLGCSLIRTVRGVGYTIDRSQ
jgi:DNA-binding response OmpR family regulator